MKNLIRFLIPKSVRKWRMVYLTYGSDIKRYLKALKMKQDTSKSEIIMLLHILEKGLTMPSTRLGFGEERVIYFCQVLEKYHKNGFDANSFEFIYAVGVLNEYLIFHQKNNFSLNQRITESIHKLNQYINNQDHTKQLEFSSESFFKDSTSNFEAFSNSRYTVRNYTNDMISDEEIKKAVKLAQKAPSSCNRQPVKVWVIKNPDIIKKALELQGGNRGFGDLVKVLLIVTTNVSYFADINERTQSSLNSGFFGMALLYALHYYKIGAATLNWSQDIRNDERLRKLVNINNNEQINFLISCGRVPPKFKVAASLRRDVESVIKIIE